MNSPEKLCMTLEEAAVALSISMSTLRRRISHGAIPAIQPGGKGTMWLVPISALDALMAGAEKQELVVEQQKPNVAGPRPRWKRGIRPGSRPPVQ